MGTYAGQQGDKTLNDVLGSVRYRLFGKWIFTKYDDEQMESQQFVGKLTEAAQKGCFDQYQDFCGHCRGKVPYPFQEGARLTGKTLDILSPIGQIFGPDGILGRSEQALQLAEQGLESPNLSLSRSGSRRRTCLISFEALFLASKSSARSMAGLSMSSMRWSTRDRAKRYGSNSICTERQCTRASSTRTGLRSRCRAAGRRSPAQISRTGGLPRRIARLPTANPGLYRPAGR